MQNERGIELKKNRTCVKCGSQKVVRIADNASVQIRLGTMLRTYAEPYVCCECGYTEMWAPQDKLEQIYDEYKWTEKFDWSQKL
jgi:ribosomal protein S27AE